MSKALSRTPSGSLTDFLADFDKSQTWSLRKWGTLPLILLVAVPLKSLSANRTVLDTSERWRLFWQ